MKKYVFVLFLLISFVVPISIISAKEKDYELIAEVPKENIVLYAKEVDGLYRDFKLVFKDGTYYKESWINVTNPAYAPKLFYEDLNGDGEEELIIILTHGYGTGLLEKEVRVFDYQDEYGLTDVLVDNPLAIISENVKTKVTPEKAEIILGVEEFTYDTSFIKPSYLFDDIVFGNIIDYDVINNQLKVRLGAQITAGRFIGDMIITYEYRDEMYQAKTMEFIMYEIKKPNYRPVRIE
ncbi:hypothetical protein [Solibacillus sp. FSL K6-1523]|uniref:hypothetical protein n=1 Tax=Solibacillus sp. FSL K6-1523 TaxID=2921471 RepID=UPI0030F6FAC3